MYRIIKLICYLKRVFTVLTLYSLILLAFNGCSFFTPPGTDPLSIEPIANEIYVVSASDNDITEGDSIDVNHSILDIDDTI